MNLKCATILGLIISSFYVKAQQWTYSTVPHLRDINSVKILRPDALIAAGGNDWNDSLQSLFISNDFGLNWTENSIDCICSVVKSVAFSDTLNGYGVGFFGKMVITHDGGHNWDFRSSPINRNLLKVAYANPHTLIAVGGAEGTGQQRTILRSVDTGTTWIIIKDSAASVLRTVYFIDNLKGFAAGDSGVILSTVDGGLNWTPVFSPIQRNFYGIAFLDANNGYIVGGSMADSIRTILKTTNGGSSWTVQKDESGGVLTDISFIDVNNGFIVGDHATFMKTTNGGAGWTLQVIPNTASFQYFTSVHFLNSNFGMIGSRGGYVYLYNNTPAPVATTTNAIINDSTDVTLVGTVNSWGYPANYTFVLALDSNFTVGGMQFLPVPVTANGPAPVSMQIQSLTPLTRYYYYLYAYTTAGGSRGDTLSFYTGLSGTSFITSPPQNITDSTVRLTGRVSNLHEPVSLTFNYGLTNSLGSTVIANPSIINDTLSHNVSALLSNLQTHTRYYCRLEGTAGTAHYLGDVVSFFTGTPYTDLQSLPASNVTSSTATLNGSVAGFVYPANISFKYGKTPQMDSTIIGSPGFIGDLSPYSITANVTSLQPYTLYYYQITAICGGGFYAGQVQTFFTGTGIDAVEVFAADQITGTTAMLHGSIHYLSDTTTLHFEYGNTPSFGTDITANIAISTDTSLKQLSALLTGLQPNTIYYYRLRASSSFGDLYSQKRQFFTGLDGIPNWDFQYWETDTITSADKWGLVSGDYARVQGHNGGSALKLWNTNAAFCGVPDPDSNFNNLPTLIWGAPISGRPDSLILWIDMAYPPGDSGAYVMRLYNAANQTIASNFGLLGGNTGGFQRMAFPVNYISAGTVDSVGFLFLTSVSRPTIATPDRYMTIDDISFSPGNQTFYNSDFETWFTYNEFVLTSWAYPVRMLVDINHPRTDFGVTQDYFSPPSDYAVNLHNVPVGGKWLSGSISTQNSFIDEGGGFPISARHASLTGYYKWLPFPGDTGRIAVAVTLNGQIIGTGLQMLVDSVPEFTRFEVPIDYQNNPFYPDTAFIGLSAAYNDHAKGPSQLIVDKLSFDGFLSDISSDDITTSGFDESIRVYPNPSSNKLIVAGVKEDNEAYITLTDISGKIARQAKTNVVTGKAEITVDDLSPGFYLLQYQSGNKTLTAKVIIAR